MKNKAGEMLSEVEGNYMPSCCVADKGEMDIRYLRIGSGSSIKPFLRWAGGKSLFVDTIIEHLPDVSSVSKYYEPFMGAASVFLSYQPKIALLSDLNDQLICTFCAIRKNHTEVFRFLTSLASCDSEEFYYSVREAYNHEGIGYLQAARFIYLNRTCFNGIFRVNKLGKFNVPYGHKKHIIIPSIEHLASVALALKDVTLTTQDFTQSVQGASSGDLVYLDPPYPPINGTSYFTHYTKERFSAEDQEEVASTANSLSARGCYVLVTNADTPVIRELYNGWTIVSILRPRYITSTKRKHKVSELIITNYPNCTYPGDSQDIRKVTNTIRGH